MTQALSNSDSSEASEPTDEEFPEPPSNAAMLGASYHAQYRSGLKNGLLGKSIFKDRNHQLQYDAVDGYVYTQGELDGLEDAWNSNG